MREQQPSGSGDIIWISAQMTKVEMMIKEFDDDDDDDMQRPLTLPHTTKTNVLITLPCLL